VSNRRRNGLGHGDIRIGGANVTLQKAFGGWVNEGRNQIVLNLARVVYIDSTGLGELISGHVTLSKKGGQITLLHLTQRLDELITITKLLTIFDVCLRRESEAADSSKIRDAGCTDCAA
jgi:anti-sigma B factor antagonist